MAIGLEERDWGRAPAAAALARVRATFHGERDRWALWLPVLQGAGIALYFALPEEPARWIGPLWLLAALAAALAGRGAPGALFVALSFGAAGLGFAAAQWRAAWVAAPTLERQIGPVEISGRVIRSMTLPEGGRLLIDRLAIRGVAAEATPARARIVVRGTAARMRPGEWVRVRAVLNPPAAPAMPGAFDFARHAWFDRLGAVGWSVGAPRAIPPPEDAFASWGVHVEALREALTARIHAALPGAAGGIAAALMTGDRGAIPESVNDAWRASGIYHLLSISGLHIGLVWGLLFLGVRTGLALAEPLALRRPIKKWAAAVALSGAFGYLLLSGAEVPTQRAFLMTALVTLAVLTDRNPLSMRLVAWAAFAVLLARPEALLTASFQMSFGAVVALIAAYELLGPTLAGWRRSGGPARIVGLYLLGVCATTLVAGFATTPFSILHFNQLVNYGLAGNLLAVPATGLWVMPFALLAFALMPFGLEGLALAPMGWGIELVDAAAAEVAGWPGAVTILPAFPAATLALAALGGLWLCLWRGRWRWWGAAAIAGGFALGPLPPPDLLIDGEGKLFAARPAGGGLELSARGRLGVVAETWLRRAGLEGPASGEAMRCDRLGCIARVKGETVAFVRERPALAEDCRAASVVLTAQWAPRRCAAATIVDRDDLAAGGAHAIWLDATGARVESVAAARGDRPWARVSGAGQ